MSIKVLSLLSCPFCRPRTGQIVVDAVALAAYRDSNPESTHSEMLHADPKQDVLIFNSDRAANKPCRHLLDIMVDFEYRSDDSDDWATSYDWQHPAAKKVDPNESCRDFLFMCLADRPGACVVCGQHHQLRKTPYQRRVGELDWRNFSAKGKQTPRYFAEARALFVRDVSVFIEEFQSLYRRCIRAERRMQKV
jgi:hypothetical protein